MPTIRDQIREHQDRYNKYRDAKKEYMDYVNELFKQHENNSHPTSYSRNAHQAFHHAIELLKNILFQHETMYE